MNIAWSIITVLAAALFAFASWRNAVKAKRYKDEALQFYQLTAHKIECFNRLAQYTQRNGNPWTGEKGNFKNSST